jgi:hypothetical protein
MTDRRNFLMYSNGQIEEVDEDGTFTFEPDQPEFYAALRKAGLPTITFNKRANVLDFSLEADGSVVAYSEGHEPRKHPQSAETAAPFLAWLSKVVIVDEES